MTHAPNKPKTSSTVIGWVITLLLSAFIGVPFFAGYIMNHTTIGLDGEGVVDWSSMTGPGIGVGVFLVFMAFDIKFKFIATGYGAMTPYYGEVEDHNEHEAEVVEPRESRRDIKNRETELKQLRADGWRELHSRHESLILEWSKYETDVALMIDYPIMTDYTDPVIHKVIAAMQKIRTAKMRLEEDSDMDAHESTLNDAVNEFEIAFHAAERYARRYGQTRLDPREQRKLSAARAALNIILDGSAPSFEIEAAYKSLRSSLKGIIDVPEKAIMEIEALVRREITTA